MSRPPSPASQARGCAEMSMYSPERPWIAGAHPRDWAPVCASGQDMHAHAHTSRRASETGHGLSSPSPASKAEAALVYRLQRVVSTPGMHSSPSDGQDRSVAGGTRPAADSADAADASEVKRALRFSDLELSASMSSAGGGTDDEMRMPVLEAYLSVGAARLALPEIPRDRKATLRAHAEVYCERVVDAMGNRPLMSRLPCVFNFSHSHMDRPDCANLSPLAAVAHIIECASKVVPDLLSAMRDIQSDSSKASTDRSPGFDRVTEAVELVYVTVKCLRQLRNAVACFPPLHVHLVSRLHLVKAFVPELCTVGPQQWSNSSRQASAPWSVDAADFGDVRRTLTKVAGAELKSGTPAHDDHAAVVGPWNLAVPFDAMTDSRHFFEGSTASFQARERMRDAFLDLLRQFRDTGLKLEDTEISIRLQSLDAPLRTLKAQYTAVAAEWFARLFVWEYMLFSRHAAAAEDCVFLELFGAQDVSRAALDVHRVAALATRMNKIEGGRSPAAPESKEMPSAASAPASALTKLNGSAWKSPLPRASEREDPKLRAGVGARSGATGTPQAGRVRGRPDVAPAYPADATWLHPPPVHEMPSASGTLFLHILRHLDSARLSATVRAQLMQELSSLRSVEAFTRRAASLDCGSSLLLVRALQSMACLHAELAWEAAFPVISTTTLWSPRSDHELRDLPCFEWLPSVDGAGSMAAVQCFIALSALRHLIFHRRAGADAPAVACAWVAALVLWVDRVSAFHVITQPGSPAETRWKLALLAHAEELLRDLAKESPEIYDAAMLSVKDCPPVLLPNEYDQVCIPCGTALTLSEGCCFSHLLRELAAAQGSLRAVLHACTPVSPPVAAAAAGAPQPAAKPPPRKLVPQRVLAPIAEGGTPGGVSRQAPEVQPAGTVDAMLACASGPLMASWLHTSPESAALVRRVLRFAEECVRVPASSAHASTSGLVATTECVIRGVMRTVVQSGLAPAVTGDSASASSIESTLIAACIQSAMHGEVSLP